MKKVLIASGVGAALTAVAYLGFPSALDALMKWREYDAQEKWHQDELDRRPRFSKIAAPTPAPLQPGLDFFQNIDEVRLLYSRSFHDEIEISIRRPYIRPDAAAELSVVVTRSTRTERKVVHSFEKKVSDEVFEEVRKYILRQDLIRKSALSGEILRLDGATWILEGRKGDFIIQHRRWSPQDDPEFLAIGKRLLILAEIKLSDEDFY